MNALEFTSLVAVISMLAGFLGSLTGLGGGVVIVPALALLFGVDIRYAIGASLVSVIATSSGAASVYVKEGIANIRIGLFLEIATTLGALTGALLSTHTTTGTIAIVFALVLAYSGVQAFLTEEHETPTLPVPNTLAARLKLNGANYGVEHVPLGFGMMFGAGAISGLLGIGSGAFKVLAMDRVMKIPFKVSTTTSNFMIGVTAAASAGVYLGRGYIEPALALPVMTGVLTGAFIGSKFLVRARVSLLRKVFAAVLLVTAAEMMFSGLTGRL